MNPKDKRILRNWQEFGNEQTAEAYFALLEACILASSKLSEHYTESESEELRVIRQAIKQAEVSK